MKKLFFIIVVLFLTSVALAKKPRWMAERHELELMEQSHQFRLEVRGARHEGKIMTIRAYNISRAERVRGIRRRRVVYYSTNCSLNSYARNIRVSYGRCPFVY